MRNTKTLLIVGAAALAMASPGARAAPADETMLTTPLGITLQELTASNPRYEAAEHKEGEKVDAKPLPFFANGGPRRGGRGTTFADVHGKSLYTYDKDTEKGKSACYEECAKNWPPAVAPVGAKAFGDWTITARTDGIKQWAYKGKPLYAFVKDTDVGEKKGDGAGNNVWHNAKFETDALQLPFGMGIAESDHANGYVLVDSRRLTMYAFDGNIQHNKLACATSTCPDHWVPVAAGQLANPKGDFTLVVRDDGFKQWAFKGKPLYTYGGDAASGDTNGDGIDKKYQVVTLARHYVPKQASIRPDPARGPIVATANGMTLYRRDTSYHQPDGHGLPGSTPGSPAVGRAMGTQACKDDCLIAWKPFVPSADAQPSGFWDIVARADGTRQWAYKGFALYTYTGDKKPGDKTGNDIYDILVTDNLKHNVYEHGPVNNTDSATMFWSYVEP